MSDIDSKPPLDPSTYQTIELDQYDIHKRSLMALRGFQVLEREGEKRRPKEPARLGESIAAYARALFEAEAKRYPDDVNKRYWLATLATRVEAMMARRIWEMDTVSVPKITFHATREEIDATMREALQSLVIEFAPAPVPAPGPEELPRKGAESDPGLRLAAASPGGTVLGSYALQRAEAVPYSPFISVPYPRPVLPSPEPLAPAPASMGNQIRTLRRESRLTIDELAAKVGIAARSVQRHEAGEVLDIRLRHLRTYEKVFSNMLKRPVRIGNVV